MRMNVSVLYREPKLLKGLGLMLGLPCSIVSVLYREPKLLKANIADRMWVSPSGFSALP